MLDELGGPKTYNHYPNGWAMAFNTPFKMWKRYEFNGGTSDPCIISWPAGIEAKGEIREQYHHAIDLVPTILDALGVEPPETIAGHVQSHFDGVSMRYSFDAAPLPSARADAVLLDARLAQHLARRLEGRHHPPDAQRLEPLRQGHLGALPHRRRPLRDARPRRRGARAPAASWSTSGTPRPAPTARSRSTTAARWRSSSRRGRCSRRRATVTSTTPASPTCPSPRRSTSATAPSRSARWSTSRRPGAEGVLFAHGSRFGGHALYVKDNRLHYVNSFVGRLEQKIVADQELPTGEQLILSAAFEKDGEDPPGVAVGTLSLFHGDEKVGEGRIGPSPASSRSPATACASDATAATPSPATTPARAPCAFTGGTINRVAIDVSGEPYVDLEREAVAMMSRE